ncbi:MAG: hypothetical protein RLZZ161_888 [Bacteroidota bacterium]|jgi:hypothetical protein
MDTTKELENNENHLFLRKICIYFAPPDLGDPGII